MGPLPADQKGRRSGLKTLDLFSDAIRQAKKSRTANLLVLFQRNGRSIDDNQQADCPWCESNKGLTFEQDEKEGWRSSCSTPECKASGYFDELGLLMLDGRSEGEAIKFLLETAGLGKLWQEIRSEHPETSETDNPSNVPQFIHLPEVGRNPYEEAWARMTLTEEHRKELRTKRGMSDEWIDAYGLKSATPENRQALAEIIDLFPPHKLLRSGIASRDSNGQIKISDILCGRVFDKAERRWITEKTIIIPYITETGGIELLRPHKRSVSNKKWREQEEASEYYEKLHNNLRIPYGKHLLATTHDEQWKHHATINEGEFKAMAHGMCGIPAIAFQGIHYFDQGKFHNQAIDDTVKLLKDFDVRHTLVVFDSEDKSHKPAEERFEAEKYARFTCECLEDAGFRALYGNLPDEWREGGEPGPNGTTIKAKADWDSRFAYHNRQNNGDFTKGCEAATAEFTRFLKSQSGDNACMVKSSRQTNFSPTWKDDIIVQGLHKLRHVYQVFTGGQREIDMAAEFENWCHPHFAHKLKIKKLAEDLRETRGGYYLHKTASEALEKRTISALTEIEEMIETLEKEPQIDEKEMRKLRAARDAAYTILYRYPKPFTDFTILSRYKIRAWNDDGTPRLDRLIIFIDKNGRRSKPFQMPADRMHSSQEMRKFYIASGDYHWNGNQDECDKIVKHIDVESYQREIEEIDTYGWNQDHEIYLFMDCAVADGKDEEPGRFLFPKKHGIIWHRNRGFINSAMMKDFSHTPPSLFPGDKKAQEAFNEIDWDQERIEVRQIWRDAVADFKENFGGYAGYALLSAILQFLAHPETLPLFGKPSIMIQGEKGSGKTQTTAMAMRLLGFHHYKPISLGSTKVGIERALTRFRGLPLHIDEWRNAKVDERMQDLFIAAYNELAQHKGTPQGGKQTRSMSPLTPAVVTGEDSTTDPALKSRYLRIIASADHGKVIPLDETEDEAIARKNQQELLRAARFDRMQKRSEEYYRVGRYIIRQRKRFSRIILDQMRKFKVNPTAVERIPQSRSRENFGTFIGAIVATEELLFDEWTTEQRTELKNMTEWFINHAAESGDEIERDVFRNRFFQEAITLIERGNIPHISRYIRIMRGSINPNGKIDILYRKDTDGNKIPILDTYEGRLLIVIRPRELFDEYQRDRRQREGSGSPIAKTNIQAELKQLQNWIRPPKKGKGSTGEHRFLIPGDGSHSGMWVLDWKKTDPDLRNIFLPIYQKELDAQGLTVTDDDRVIQAEEEEIGF